MGKGGKSTQSGWEAVTTGFVIAAVFGFLYLRGGSWIWIFPAVFGGVLPMVDGVRKIVSGRASRRAEIEARTRRPEDLEREVLRLARDHGGVLTPSLIAVESDISVADAERVLGDLAARGHASVEVRENGRVEYEFAEFMRRLDPPAR